MKEPSIQQLLQVADDSYINQGTHIGCLTLTQLLTLQPRTGQHTTTGQLSVSLGHNHLCTSKQQNSRYIDLLAMTILLAGLDATIELTTADHALPLPACQQPWQLLSP